MPIGFFSKYLVIWPVFCRKSTKKMCLEHLTPQISKWVKCVIFWKIGHGPQLMPAPAFFWFFSNLTSFSRKSDKNRAFLHISPPYIKVGQILGLSKNGSWVLVDGQRFLFYGSWIRACTESFGDVPKYFGLLKEVGHIAKWWVFTEITFFGSNFFRSVIRACTGSFANVCAGTSPLYIKVGQISELSKNGSWVLVDACNFFFLIY